MQARLWLLRQLELLGRGESVDSVAALLQEKDAQIHDAAIRCLARNPAPEATTRLIAALPKLAGKARVGLINALGYRADKAAVVVLADELKGKDDDAAKAAAKSLGKIGNPNAMEVLEKSLKSKDLKDDRANSGSLMPACSAPTAVCVKARQPRPRQSMRSLPIRRLKSVPFAWPRFRAS